MNELQLFWNICIIKSSCTFKAIDNYQIVHTIGAKEIQLVTVTQIDDKSNQNATIAIQHCL